jgi:hypothetical protein
MFDAFTVRRTPPVCRYRVGKNRTHHGRNITVSQRRDMHLVQLLLPIVQSAEASTGESLQALRKELIEKFGGVTAYTRSPAKGSWLEDDDHVVQDDVIIVEVMTDQLEHEWWRTLRARLEHQLNQQSIVIRSSKIEML